MPGSSNRTGGRCSVIDLYAPSAFEVSSGWLHGFVGEAVRERTHESAAEALRSVLRDQVLSGPCVVPFSGGRDSSLILAVACSVAREADAELPTALTFRYPAHPDADEDAWQEMVVDHLARLGLRPSWRIRTIADELDVVGPLMGPLLEESGHSLWPPSVASTVAVAQEAAGATVLSGEYGDGVLGLRRATFLQHAVKRRGRNLSAADWQAIALAAVPRSAYALGVRARGWAPSWLTLEGRRRWRQVAAIDARGEPLRWDRSISRSVSSRAGVLGAATFRQLSGRWGARFVAPLADPRVVGALAREGGGRGLGSRTVMTRKLAGGILPEELCARGTKADFSESRFHRHTRAVIGSWHGAGADTRWVDIAALRAAWTSGAVHPLTAGLIQAAWLAEHGIGES